MTKLQRADRLKEPAIIGQQYLVPMVHGRWHGMIRNWPVMGRKHDDIEHFHFRDLHYHLDTRFLRVRRVILERAMFAPLHAYGDFKSPAVPLGPVKLLRRTCLRDPLPFEPTTSLASKVMSSFRGAFAGQQCPKGKRGWVCPHRQFPLGPIPAVDGVINCPLHGLRINAETGVVVGSAPTVPQ